MFTRSILSFALLLLCASCAADDDDAAGAGESFPPDDGAGDGRGNDNDFASDQAGPVQPGDDDTDAEHDWEELAQRAQDYGEWAEAWHLVPPFGSLFEVQFTDDSNTEVYYYEGRWDSTLWTGIYAGSQCLRYNVTGEPEAQDNAVRALRALHHHLMVTGVRGYVSRFVVPNEWIYAHGHQDPADPICHDGQGEYEGTRWCENTSRDQYTGWWFAQAVCYDFLDDPDALAMIREDVAAATDYFHENRWTIIRPDGERSTAGPDIGALMQLDWTLIAAHILDRPDLYEYYEALFDRFAGPRIEIDAWSLFNRYAEYYGNNLRWATAFNLWRLEWDPVKYRHYVDAFAARARPYTEWTHNVWLDLIWLYGCKGSGQCRDEEALLKYIRDDIVQFHLPPNRHLPVEGAPELPPDPFPRAWNDVLDRLVEMGFPEYLADEIRLNEQPLFAQEVRFQCHEDFQWQRSPFHNTCPGGDGSFVSSGVDFLMVYWLGRWMNVIPPGNPNFPGWGGGRPEGDGRTKR